MADTMQFDLVSPERKLASVQAVSVQIPGADGDLTAMPDHAPLITTLRPGLLTVNGPEGEMKYVVTGGFAEISSAGTSVLAERAMPVSEVTQDTLDEFLNEAVDARDNATPEALDALAKQASDIAILGTQIGLSSRG
ncbi:F0F1 ATP synthase subunit epsilon [Cochlodiniinecator piscidefendens]|uniref:F0F1 ATP synthase subunit epsilon n=1 Tax=Cochlodiniinecator piscidefendens TaxID=2715756 RepID=UPI00140AF9D7|nr:F0F1 ATP synthase subunit epsilon [Cochlodiniinecator piscidefendens]